MDAGALPSEAFGKMRRLMEILSALDEEESLRDRLALHGGTAINAFYLDLPRMSVDIDLSFIGDVDGKDMMKTNDEVVGAVRHVAEGMGYRARYGKNQHAGRTIRLYYDGGYIKADVNFMNRVPVFQPERRASRINPSVSFPMLSYCDTVGGKVRALLGRTTARDLFDISTIAKTARESDGDLLHATLLLYATLADLFPHGFEDSFSDGMRERFLGLGRDIEENLVPMLATDVAVPSLDDLIADAERFVRDNVDPRSELEAEYVSRMRRADFRPELILPEEQAKRARRFPEALWKVRNLKEYVAMPSRTQQEGRTSPSDMAREAREVASRIEGRNASGRGKRR